MRKVTAADLEAMQKDGAVIKRRSGGLPRKPDKMPDTKPEKPPVEMASMRASQKHYDAQAEALRLVVAANTAMIETLREQLKDLKPVPQRDPVPYEFTIERNRDKLIERVLALPLMEE
jgi:hypothetical protein